MKKLLVSVLLFSFFLPSFASAQTAAELQALIQSLLKQVSELQTKLNTTSGTQSVITTQTRDCSITVDTNLYFGLKSAEVFDLQNILLSKGYITADNVTGYFGYTTVAAVRKFQAENGIEQTGTVGPITRAKLNESCSTSTSIPLTPIISTPTPTWIRVSSPNGGEEYLSEKGGFTARWEGAGKEPVNLYLLDSSVYNNVVQNIASRFIGSEYSVSIAADLLQKDVNKFKLRVCFSNYPTICDTSDNTFSFISAITAEPSIKIKAISGSNSSESSITVNIGDTFNISGIPQNLQGLSYWFGDGVQPSSGYFSRAYFFDQNFANNNLCGNNEALATGVWTMTCTAKVSGSSYFYIDIYANGKTYRSNIVTVNIASATPQPPITILSPNGGEQWKMGSLQTIKWSDPAASSNSRYTVFLTKVNGSAYGIIGEVYGQPWLNWTVGEVTLGGGGVSVTSGSEYYVQVVKQYVSPYTNDQSNAPFSIISDSISFAPTASLTTKGIADYVFASVGETITHKWSSTNADSAKSSYTVYPEYTSANNCGGLIGSGPFTWVANTLEGSDTGTVQSCQAGRTYVITYTVAQAKGGQTASKSITVYVPGGVSSTQNSSQMASTLVSLQQTLQNILKSLSS